MALAQRSEIAALIARGGGQVGMLLVTMRGGGWAERDQLSGEFAAIWRAKVIDGLIAALNRNADLLTETTARVKRPLEDCADVARRRSSRRGRQHTPLKLLQELDHRSLVP
jgi:hypothetical protein